MRLLVLKYDILIREAICLNRETHELLHANLESVQPQIGHILVVENLKIVKIDGVCFISPECGTIVIESPTPEDCVILPKEKTDVVMFKSWIGFSSDPSHLTYDRNIGYADWYGPVNCSQFKAKNTKVAFFKYLIAVNDLDYKNTGECLMKAVQLVGVIDNRDAAEVRLKMMEFERKRIADIQRTTKQTRLIETVAYPILPSAHQPSSNHSYTGRSSCDSLRPQPVPAARKLSEQPQTVQNQAPYREQINQQRSVTNSIYGEFSGVGRTDQPLETANSRGSTEYYSGRSSSSSDQVIRNEPQLPNPAPILPESMGMVTYENGIMQIVYLRSVQKAAIHYWSRHQITTSLGSVFNCSFKPIPVQATTHWAPFEITAINNVNNEKNEVKTVGKECFALFKVDLSRPEGKFSKWTTIGGNPIFSCEIVGYVMLAHSVLGPQQNQLSILNVAQNYYNRKVAENICCFCRFVRRQVPRMMVDSHWISEDEEVEVFIWELVEIVGASELYRKRQEQLEIGNLGDTADNVKRHNDDIEMQKKRAQQEHFAQQQRPAGSSNSYQTENAQQHSMSNNMQYYHSQAPPVSSRSSISLGETAEFKNKLERTNDMMESLCDAIKKFLDNRQLKETLRGYNPRRLQALEEKLKECSEHLENN